MEYADSPGTGPWYETCTLLVAGGPWVGRVALKFLLLPILSAGLLLANPQVAQVRPAAKMDCAATVGYLGWTPDPKWEGTDVEKFFRVLGDIFPAHHLDPLTKHHPVVMKVTAQDGKVLVAKTVRYNDAPHRQALAREAKLLASLPGKHFVTAKGTYQLDSKSDYKIPVYWMDYYPAGTLADHLEKLGPILSVEELLEIFRLVTLPVQILHQEGYGNGDVKPENYLVKKEGEKITEVLMSDLGSAARFDDEDGSRMFTPSYLDPDFSPGEVPWKAFTRDLTKRDMNALRITLQEILLGKRLFKLSRDFLSVQSFQFGEARHSIHALTHSPKTIDSSIPEVLSAIAWVKFPSPESLLKALAAAKVAIKTGKLKPFYSQTIYPVLSEGKSANSIAYAIVHSTELMGAFEKGMLGLSIFSKKDREVSRQVKILKLGNPLMANR